MTKRPQEPAARSSRSRAALIAAGIVLLACVAAAALIEAGGDEESVARLGWVETERIPDSPLIEIPNSFGHEMGILEPELRATGPNGDGESLFAAAATLWMDAGSPLEGARARCSLRAPKGAEVARGPTGPASYPRPGKPTAQSVPSLVQVSFDTEDAELATVDMGELIGVRLATEEGTELEWPSGRPGEQRFEWVLPPEPSGEEVELRFAGAWRTVSAPAVNIACSLTTRDGTVTRRTGGALPSS